MKYYFWQLRISPHQASFLENLAESHEVFLIVQNTELSAERVKIGWKSPEFKKVKVIYSPSFYEINRILKEKNNIIHIYSSYFQNIKILFSIIVAAKRKLTFGIMAEPFDWFGVKGKVRKCREVLFFRLVNKKASFFLAIGNVGLKIYSSIGFNSNKIFEWGYFIEKNRDLVEPSFSDNHDFILTYIGRLAEGKGLENLVEVLSKIKLSFHLYLIGEGPLKEQLQNLVLNKKISNNFSFLGALANTEIYPILGKTDLLILPSDKKDGWGVVINEALLTGVPVLCSNNCGASTLIKKEYLGSVFQFDNLDELQYQIELRIKSGKINSNDRDKISSWAKENISCNSAKQYFDYITSFVNGETEIKPLPPWHKIE